MFCLLEFYQRILTISCFERTAGKCSLTWHSGLVRNCYLQLELNLSHAMTFIKWIRYSWFHFNIFNKNSKWHGSHGHHIHPPGHFLLFLFLLLLFLMCSIEKGTLLVRVASPFTVETLFISLRGKKRGEISLKL